MPSISVIVPVYNAEPYLAQCIESLLCQTHRDLQIILVNDGSTDNSLAIAERYTRADARVELYTQPDLGQSAARNNGMLHATGDYLSFIDADDYIDAGFYQTLLQTCRPDTDVVQIGYRRVQEGKVLTEQCPRTFFQFTSPCMRLYRRDFLTRHRLTFTEGMIYEDVLFSIDLWSAHPTYRMAHYTGYNYRLTPHSTTAARNRQAEQTLFAALRQRYTTSHDWKLRLQIIYTYVRLKLHFAYHE